MFMLRGFQRECITPFSDAWFMALQSVRALKRFHLVRSLNLGIRCLPKCPCEGFLSTHG